MFKIVVNFPCFIAVVSSLSPILSFNRLKDGLREIEIGVGERKNMSIAVCPVPESEGLFCFFPRYVVLNNEHA